MKIVCPYRVLFVSKYLNLNTRVKALLSNELSHQNVETVCYTNLDFFHKGFYINYDLAFIDVSSLTTSQFVKLNALHKNWHFLRLILLVERASASKLSVFFEKLQDNCVKNEFEYLTIDNYSNELLGLACLNYCKESLNLLK
ncbi:hypothetical protein [Parvicella tangerina]|uniref:Uncharacterized protein n=1 Tax=Parvicella tangerina TaxID=2829795 RepID=A0A916NEY3_9FLAO|nr:hypothetical protein [Parvicella tangerina]CAG5076385.1 hypothetical protein CRYO30217_00093 [Parvicella tangerina]